MELPRQDPDRLLRAIQEGSSQEGSSSRSAGKLVIFFGYAAGVGKTYTMLQAAHQAKNRGIDVVAGYIEPHARPQTAALTEGLETLPPKQVTHGDIVLREFDLDAALKRRPRLILVDELAHTNAEGSRHAKRYQDVQELLNAGIDVYTTINVQHIESLNDHVASVTGVKVHERIPDSVFDKADRVKLIDIEPAELLERLASGNVYKEDQARRATANFFSLENLTALREIALRRVADRVNILTESARVQSRGDYHTDEHILVCLSPEPQTAKLIRAAARMASAFRGHFTALVIETPDSADFSEDDKKRMRDHIHLAEQLGAVVETIRGDDIVSQISEFARLAGVSKIVIGRGMAKRRGIFGKPSPAVRLAAEAPNLDIHVIPDSGGNDFIKTRKKSAGGTVWKDIAISLGIFLAATVLGYILDENDAMEANIVAIYILAVLIISVVTTNRIIGAVASVLSVLIFDFFFTIPRYSLEFNKSEYIVTFVIMFLVSLLSGTLASRIKKNAKLSAEAAYRTGVLLETNRLLQKETDEPSVIRSTAEQLLKLLNVDIVVYLYNPTCLNKLPEPLLFRAAESGRTMQLDETELISENEKAVAAWVMKNNSCAGATTDTLSNAKCLYYTIRSNENVFGAVGIALNGVTLEPFEKSIMLSILGECALAIENIRNGKYRAAD